MCSICENGRLSRRGFLSMAGAGVASGLTGAAPAFASDGAATALTGHQALAKLRAGNARFVRSPELCVTDLSQQRAHVAGHQAPWATIVSCADSRVPPELLFGGLGIGELFVARNAGNMVDTATMGTIEYGSGVRGVPLIVVLGHQRCGAVAAACDIVTRNAQFPGSIGPMVQAIVPAVRAVVGRSGDLLANAVRESATRTAWKIVNESPIISDLYRKGKVGVVVGIYDLDQGKVDFLL